MGSLRPIFQAHGFLLNEGKLKIQLSRERTSNMRTLTNYWFSQSAGQGADDLKQVNYASESQNLSPMLSADTLSLNVISGIINTPLNVVKLRMTASVCLCLPAYTPVCLSACLHACLPTRLFVCVSACLPAYPPVCSLLHVLNWMFESWGKVVRQNVTHVCLAVPSSLPSENKVRSVCLSVYPSVDLRSFYLSIHLDISAEALQTGT